MNQVTNEPPRVAISTLLNNQTKNYHINNYQIYLN